MPRSTNKANTRSTDKPNINGSLQLKQKTSKNKKIPRAHQSVLFFRPEESAANLRKAQKVIEILGIDNMDALSYIPALGDKPELVSVKVVDLMKAFGGRGLFANVDIGEGDVLGTYSGEQYSSGRAFIKHLSAHPNTDNSYAMQVGSGIVDSAEKGNYTRYINFSDNEDNVAFVENEIDGQKTVTVIALKGIKAGQQLLVNYNRYNQKASTEYFFLSPQDGWQSASEVYLSHVTLYQPITINYALKSLNLKRYNMLYATEVGMAVATNTRLAPHRKTFTQDEINLPFLKIGRNNKTVMEFSEADSFTPLMYAAYFGQFENVQWLVSHGANMNQQQNHSGNNALFFALAGYAETSNMSDAYLAIMKSLISAQAHLFAHDREDKTFLHKAVETLSTQDFYELVTYIFAQEPQQFEELCLYIDNENRDPILLCLANKAFEKARAILTCYPQYFKTGYLNHRNKSLDIFNKEILKGIIETYDAEAKENLLLLLEEFGVSGSSNLVNVLGLTSEKSYSLR